MLDEKSTIDKLADWEDDEIDLELDQIVSRLAFCNASDSTICHALNISKESFDSRFAGVAQQARARGDMCISFAQMQAARRGNAQLLIWLGKQRLNQREPKDEPSNELQAQLTSMMQGKSTPLLKIADDLPRTENT